jgi:hypothetical protein
MSCSICSRLHKKRVSSVHLDLINEYRLSLEEKDIIIRRLEEDLRRANERIVEENQKSFEKISILELNNAKLQKNIERVSIKEKGELICEINQLNNKIARQTIENLELNTKLKNIQLTLETNKKHAEALELNQRAKLNDIERENDLKENLNKSLLMKIELFKKEIYENEKKTQCLKDTIQDIKLKNRQLKEQKDYYLNKLLKSKEEIAYVNREFVEREARVKYLIQKFMNIIKKDSNLF